MEEEKSEEDKIGELQKTVIVAREMFLQVANKKFKEGIKKKMEFFDTFEPRFEERGLPRASVDVADGAENDVTALRDELKKAIKLIQILSHKLDCPISQIVDAV